MSEASRLRPSKGSTVPPHEAALLRLPGITLKRPLLLEPLFGRLGNNLQQMMLATLYGEKHGLGVIVKDHAQVRGFRLGPSRYWPSVSSVKNRFFFFNPDGPADCDIDIGYTYACQNMHQAAQRHIRPNLKTRERPALPSDTLVIHIRAGDVFGTGDASVRNYVQNPLSFYEGLIDRFESAIVVTESLDNNPIVNRLAQRPDVQVQSSTVDEDFATLMAAQNLASSGVGTFSIAAALCSVHLRNFYCTDAYMAEHLNPETLGHLNVFHTRLGDAYPKIGDWSGSDAIIEQMLTYQVENLNVDRACADVLALRD